MIVTPGRLPGAQEADPVHLSGLLCLSGERRGEYGSEASHERAVVHPLRPAGCRGS
jgi:hypothetical protein